jgi:hypothetical protein
MKAVYTLVINSCGGKTTIKGLTLSKALKMVATLDKLTKGYTVSIVKG